MVDTESVYGTTVRSKAYFKRFSKDTLKIWGPTTLSILDDWAGRIYVKDEDSPVFNMMHKIDTLTRDYIDPYKDSRLKKTRKALMNLEDCNLEPKDISSDLQTMLLGLNAKYNNRVGANPDRSVLSNRLFLNLLALGLSSPEDVVRIGQENTTMYLEKYWNKVVMRGIGEQIFKGDLLTGLMRSVGIQFRQKHSERTNLAAGVYQFAKSLHNPELLGKLLGYIKPFYMGWRSLNDEQKENLYGATLLVKGRLMKVDPKDGFYTLVEPEVIEEVKKKMTRIQSNGHVILAPVSLLIPIGLMGAALHKGNGFSHLLDGNERARWIIDEAGLKNIQYFCERVALRAIQEGNVAADLRELIGRPRADII